MPRYRYRAINALGEVVKGELTALHMPDMQAQLKAAGLSLISSKNVFTIFSKGGPKTRDGRIAGWC